MNKEQSDNGVKIMRKDKDGEAIANEFLPVPAKGTVTYIVKDGENLVVEFDKAYHGVFIEA